MTYEPLHHKYRPQTFAHLVGQDAISQTLCNALKSGRIAPAYLFTGPRGTGKTSSARILAKSLNCLAFPSPTDSPCGVCDVCRSVAGGNSLDVIEIDAASNTGVDNIRELIERAQFAPVQCRKKVYIIDECLTGDSLIQTRQGLARIDDPSLKGQEVLSYNERSQAWEYKTVTRWLHRGIRPTLTIKTTHRELRCTGNHLLLTHRGWIAAQNLLAGDQIVTPVALNLETSHNQLLSQRQIAPSVPVAVAKDSIYLNSSTNQAEDYAAYNPTGRNIPIEKVTVCGYVELRTSSPNRNYLQPSNLVSSMGHSWVMPPLATPTPTADFPESLGLMALSNKLGWSTKLNASVPCKPKSQPPLIKATASCPFADVPSVILNWLKFSILLNPIHTQNKFVQTGYNGSHQKEWLGGTWMMAPLALHQPEAPKFNSILKDIPPQKTSFWLNGSVKKDIQPSQSPISDLQQAKPITTFGWEQIVAENGYQISSNTQSPRWITNLEKVEFVSPGGVDNVYDLEVEDNHNFVANGLTVHNCHMLSVAAFNSLLKTLEEPPDHVVFVLATTDPQRVLPTIISRCQRFDFRRIPLEAMVAHLKHIAQQENIDIAGDALTLVAQIAQGGLRDAESLLDQLSLLVPPVTVEKVWDLVGAVPERDLMALLNALDSQNAEAILEQARSIMNRGREPLVLLQNLAGFYRDLLIAKTAPNRSDLVAVTGPTWVEMCQFSQRWTLDRIIAGQQILRQSETQIKNTTQPRLWLEVALLGLLQTATQTPPAVSPSFSSPPPAPPAPAPQPPAPQPNYTTLPNTPTISPPPTPAPAAQIPVNSSPPPIAPAPQESSHGYDLHQVWQTVLTCLQPLGTKELLRQHCRLLSFNGSVAHISIKNLNLYKIAQGKIPNVEQAFSQVFQKQITVRLEVAGAPAAPPISHQQPPTVAPIPPTTTPPAYPQINQTPAPSTTPSPETQAPPSINPSITNQNPVNSEMPVTVPVSHPINTPEDKLANAIQLLISNFNGKEIPSPFEEKSQPSTVPVREIVPDLDISYSNEGSEENYLELEEDPED